MSSPVFKQRHSSIFSDIWLFLPTNRQWILALYSEWTRLSTNHRSHVYDRTFKHDEVLCRLFLSLTVQTCRWADNFKRFDEFCIINWKFYSRQRRLVCTVSVCCEHLSAFDKKMTTLPSRCLHGADPEYSADMRPFEAPDDRGQRRLILSSFQQQLRLQQLVTEQCSQISRVQQSVRQCYVSFDCRCRRFAGGSKHFSLTLHCPTI